MGLAAQLYYRITLQQRSTAQDAYGQQAAAWSDVASVWAGIEHTDGKEDVASASVQPTTTAKVTIRWRADVTPKMRVVYRGQAWNIGAVLPQRNNRELLLLCTAGGFDG